MRAVKTNCLKAASGIAVLDRMRYEKINEGFGMKERARGVN